MRCDAAAAREVLHLAWSAKLTATRSLETPGPTSPTLEASKPKLVTCQWRACQDPRGGVVFATVYTRAPYTHEFMNDLASTALWQMQSPTPGPPAGNRRAARA